MSDLENFTPQLTADGSFTFVSQEFGECFHSHYGARQESFFKFVEPTQLATVAQKPVLRLLDICYGLGYNTAAALQTIWAVNPGCCVEVIGLEVNPAVPQAAIAHKLFDNWNCNYIEILSQLAFKHQVETAYRRSPGTVAAHSASAESQNHSIVTSLSQVEKEHLLTRAAIPYRDPELSDSTEVIVMRRQQEQKISSLEPTSRWRKKWLLGT